MNHPPASGEPYRSPSPASFASLPRTTSPPVRHSSPLNPQQEAASQSVDNGRSMFGTFVSPFDAFSSVPAPSTTRKKPVPPVNPQAQSQPAPSSSPARSISPRVVQDSTQQFPRRYMSPEDPFVNANTNQSDGEVQPSGDRPINPGRLSPMSMGFIGSLNRLSLIYSDIIPRRSDISAPLSRHRSSSHYLKGFSGWR